MRGKVGLLKDGTVVATQGLETDRLDTGICGTVEFALKATNGQVLAHGQTARHCIPGKAPGGPLIVDIPSERLALSPSMAKDITDIAVLAVCGSANPAPFGIGGMPDVQGHIEVETGPKKN